MERRPGQPQYHPDVLAQKEQAEIAAARTAFHEYLSAKLTRQAGDEEAEKAWKKQMRRVNRLQDKFPDVFYDVIRERGPEEARWHYEQHPGAKIRPYKEPTKYERYMRDVQAFRQVFPELYQERLQERKSRHNE